ncbi:probable terpene synthase 6 [Hibiscus syriacus]|uniref:probable terpene synthase 6 n=1 Tax=Hibiscus syriacus TaxID=106335 RepID=UPI001923503B|nr:probable terpene synthase 6 [Hibiscus syriacus]
MGCSATDHNSETKDGETNRPLANFSPDIWGDRFLTLSFHPSELESCSRQVEVLKETVKDMLIASTADPIHNIFLINTLCRLGVSHHFESEIHKQLTLRFDTLCQLTDNNDYELHTITVIFQVFRFHGYNMSSDVFNKFKHGNGEFKVSDTKGMISLYEATQFRTNGELVLDDAFAFTTSKLTSMKSQLSSPHYAEYIVNALNHPYHKSMPRLEARKYICFYEKEDDARNETLLKFAKYDFNRIQMILQQELSNLCRWWKEENMESRFPCIRHRLVENFFVAVGFYFEPRFARARSIDVKLLSILGLIDDTYDAYGTYEELQCFTDAIQRFDISAMDQLPTDHLKLVYECVLKVLDEVEKQVRKEGRSYAVSYIRNERESLRFVVEPLLSINASKYFSYGAKDEEKRGVVCGTNCYVKQYGGTRQEAVEAFKEMIEAAWKDMNEACLDPIMPVSNPTVMRVINCARLLENVYEDNNGFSMPELSLKHHIANLLLHPLPL